MLSFPRCTGIIMPVFSLPSPYGIGTLGAAAHEFAEFLSRSGQSLWQVLPLGPTGFGDSPYQSFSTFAGNPYFIDLQLLIDMGLLTEQEVSAYDWGEDPEGIDYEKIYLSRLDVLRKAYSKADDTVCERVTAFAEKNAYWLSDYALFMSLKRKFNMQPWYMWPEDIRTRTENSLETYTAILRDDIQLEYFIQYLFFEQLSSLRQHCARLGVQIIGDLPIYVAHDSADVWSNPEAFLLDEKFTPIDVAGVPPDYFSQTGQLWGNPLYRWDDMALDDFSWWKCRLAAASSIYDIIRIDHFRGLESYWSVPYGSETAESGKWNFGPGRFFLDMLRNNFPKTCFIAEDLGIITPEVSSLREYAEMPGMAVLSFAFQPNENSTYLPHNLTRTRICYTGTHDNDTLSGFLHDASHEERAYIRSYCGDDTPLAIIRSGMASCAKVFISQIQDWLALGSEARINTPGAQSNCWRWRILPGELNSCLEETMSAMAKTFSRCSAPGIKEENT